MVSSGRLSTVAVLLPALLGAVIATGVLLGRERPGVFAIEVPEPTPAALVSAVSDGDLARVSALLQAGVSGVEPAWYRNADLFGRRAVQATPLYVAVAEGDEAMVRLLLGRGLAPDEAATCIGTRLERTDILRLLRLSGADVDAAACQDESRLERLGTAARQEMSGPVP